MRPGLATWLRFNAVGAAGFGVQAGTLQVLLYAGGLHYLAATALAVEAAVLHNFWWHRRWTWGGREAAKSTPAWRLLLQFHATHGLSSMVGTVLFMRLLVGAAGLRPAWAILASTCLSGLVSLLNFFILDRYVFAKRLGRQPRL